MQAVVLAGGLATRLGPLCRDRPKLLVEVAGRPFADWILERLVDAGFDRVLLCIGHLGEQIRGALGDGRSRGIELSYAEDGPTLRGTGGALRAAMDRLEPTFLVTYGDSLLPFDYAAPLLDLRAHPDALGTLSVFRNCNQHDRSNVVAEDDRVVEYRKLAPGDREDPRVVDIDYGAMALRRGAVEALPARGSSSLGDLQALLAARGQLRAYRARRCFYEIGSRTGLERLERALGRSPDLSVASTPPTQGDEP